MKARKVSRPSTEENAKPSLSVPKGGGTGALAEGLTPARVASGEPGMMVGAGFAAAAGAFTGVGSPGTGWEATAMQGNRAASKRQTGRKRMAATVSGV